MVNAISGSSPIAFPDSNTYRVLLQSYFPRDSEERKQELWETFLQTYGYTINPSNTDELAKGRWVTFLNEIDKKPVPTTGFYADTLDEILGTTLSASEKQAIWERFLARMNYTFNPGSADQAAEVEFIKFLQQLLVETYYEGSSPSENTKRGILLDTFSLIISLLSLLQGTVRVHSDSLIFFSKMQETLTKLMAKTIVYTDSPDPIKGWNVNKTNLDEWKLGYPVSIKDICNFTATSIKEGQSQDFIFTNKTATNDSTYMTVTFTSNPAGFDDTTTPGGEIIPGNPNGVGMEIQFFVRDPPPPGSIDFLFMNHSVTMDLTDLQALSVEHISEKLQTAWLALYEGRDETLSDVATTYSYPPLYTGSPSTDLTNYTGVTNTAEAITNFLQQNTVLGLIKFPSPGITIPYTGSANAAIRGEVNTRMQQYIENLRSQRDAWKNRQKVIEGQLDRDKEGVAQLGNFISSIHESIRNLLSGIFR